MKQNYNSLTNFLSDNVFKLDIIDKTRFKFSPDRYKFINQLFNNIIFAERTYETSVITTLPLNVSSEFPRGISYQYCPKPIRSEIENMTKVGMQYSFQINSRKFKIFFICSDKTENVNKFMNQSIKRIYMWLHLASQYANMDCSKNMNVYLYLTPLSKLLPEDNTPISQVNANTAFTTPCKPLTEIVIFRLEEWFKTFIHETFHNMGLDFSAYNNDKVNAEIYTMFPVNTDVRLYETYCETWAELFAVMFTVYHSMRHNTRIEDIPTKIPNMIKNVEKNIILEVYHSLFQVVKILSHYGLTYEKLLERQTNLSDACTYKEDTPVLSYYIIKSILLFNIGSFIKWCADNNSYSINFTNLTSKDTMAEKMSRYCHLIRTYYKEPTYVNTLNSMNNFFKTIKHTKKNKYVLENLRMTITEY